MNFIFTLNSDTKKLLSSLGLNISYLTGIIQGKKGMVTVGEVLFTLYCCKQQIQDNDDLVFHNITESRVFKKETLFKGIWIYKNNVCPIRLYEVITSNEDKKRALIQRLDIMMNVLTTNT